MKYLGLLCLCVLMAALAMANPNPECSLEINNGTRGLGRGFRFFYFSEQNVCLRLYYFGYRGNANNFPTKALCEQKCKRTSAGCKQPLRPGLMKGRACKMRIQFFYHARNKSCYPFLYRGCEGNDNRFDSVWQCKKTCR